MEVVPALMKVARKYYFVTYLFSVYSNTFQVTVYIFLQCKFIHCLEFHQIDDARFIKFLLLHSPVVPHVFTIANSGHPCSHWLWWAGAFDIHLNLFLCAFLYCRGWKGADCISQTPLQLRFRDQLGHAR